MTWYHAFLTYRDMDGAICHLIQYDITSISILHSELLVPLQAQRPLSLDGHVIPGTPAIQRLQIYQSACQFTELQLPDGSGALDHPPDTVRFLFERGVVEGVELYTPSILLPFLRTVAASSRDREEGDLSTMETKSRPPVHSPKVYLTTWLYYVLCGYAALGNTVITGLVRWVETGSHPTALGALLRYDALALTWPMMTSMLVGLGLLGMYYLVLLMRGSRRLLTLMNSSLLAVIVTTNLVNLFTTSLVEQVSNGMLLRYAVPYLLLIGIVAGISFTFMTPQLPDRPADRGGHAPETHHRPQVVLVAFTFMLLFSAVFTYLGLSSDYRIAYPLWFSYLLGGIVLWAVILRSQRRLARRHDGRIVHEAPLAVTFDPPLPSLPPLDTQGVESLALPLPPLRRTS
jgi:hypothetical protein